MCGSSFFLPMYGGYYISQLQNIQKSDTIFLIRRDIDVSSDLLSIRYRQMPLVPRSWSLSRKRHSNGHMYYYKQTGDKTCYVRRRDESQVLAEYDERQKWRQERKELNQQLLSLSPAERREARQQMRLYQEHMEKLDDPQYRRKQIEKIKNYKTHDIRLGENLVITSSYKHFQASRILWQLVIRGVLSDSKTRKLIKKNKK